MKPEHRDALANLRECDGPHICPECGWAMSLHASRFKTVDGELIEDLVMRLERLEATTQALNERLWQFIERLREEYDDDGY